MIYINRLKYPVLLIIFVFFGLLLGFLVNTTVKHQYINKIHRLTNEINYLRTSQGKFKHTYRDNKS